MMSEAELHVLRSRLYQGKLNKARRGELFSFVPIGYVRTPEGGIALEPDEQARSAVQIVFEKVAELGSARHSQCLPHCPRYPPGSAVVPWPGQGRLDLASAAAQYHLRHAPPPVLRRGVRVRSAPGRSDQAGRRQGRAARSRPGGRVGSVCCATGSLPASAGSSTRRTGGGWRRTTGGGARARSAIAPRRSSTGSSSADGAVVRWRL